MLLPLQGASPNVHPPRALPWAGCLMAFQAVTSHKVHKTPIKKSHSPPHEAYTFNIYRDAGHKLTPPREKKSLASEQK